jgi:AcrR family transcriptional regulator
LSLSVNRERGRGLTREEAKLITRRRLLEAAARVLRESGHGGLSASAVAREAGVAQPTFYVHFVDKDDLMQTLAREKVEGLRGPLREARARIKRGSGIDAVRETFLLPVKALLEDPDLFRLYVQEGHHPNSPFGEEARKLRSELQADLAADLIELGAPARTSGERARLDMIADAILAQAEALGLGLIEGRYPQADAVVDVLTQMTVGTLSLLGVLGEGKASEAGAAPEK